MRLTSGELNSKNVSEIPLAVDHIIPRLGVIDGNLSPLPVSDQNVLANSE